jgi:hypothetical protein
MLTIGITYTYTYLTVKPMLEPYKTTILNRVEVKSASIPVSELAPAGSESGLAEVVESSVSQGTTPTTSIERKLKDTFGEEYKTARAVMMAESRGNCEAVGDTHLARPSIGLFQISQIYHNYDTETLMNPDENIRIAKEIRDNGGWDRWTTYRDKSYLSYME